MQRHCATLSPHDAHTEGLAQTKIRDFASIAEQKLTRTEKLMSTIKELQIIRQVRGYPYRALNARLAMLS